MVKIKDPSYDLDRLTEFCPWASTFIWSVDCLKVAGINCFKFWRHSKFLYNLSLMNWYVNLFRKQFMAFWSRISISVTNSLTWDIQPCHKLSYSSLHGSLIFPSLFFHACSRACECVFVHECWPWGHTHECVFVYRNLSVCMSDADIVKLKPNSKA